MSSRFHCLFPFFLCVAIIAFIPVLVFVGIQYGNQKYALTATPSNCVVSNYSIIQYNATYDKYGWKDAYCDVRAVLVCNNTRQISQNLNCEITYCAIDPTILELCTERMLIGSHYNYWFFKDYTLSDPIFQDRYGNVVKINALRPLIACSITQGLIISTLFVYLIVLYKKRQYQYYS